MGIVRESADFREKKIAVRGKKKLSAKKFTGVPKICAPFRAPVWAKPGGLILARHKQHGVVESFSMIKSLMCPNTWRWDQETEEVIVECDDGPKRWAADFGQWNGFEKML